MKYRIHVLLAVAASCLPYETSTIHAEEVVAVPAYGELIAVNSDTIDDIPIPEFPPLKEDKLTRSQISDIIKSKITDKGFTSRVPDKPGMSSEDLKTITLVDIRGLPLANALRFLSDTTGLNLVPSVEASQIEVSLYLKNVTAWAAIDALAKAHNLYATQDSESDIVRLHTEEEYRRYQGQFVDAGTQVFTLLYPNALDIATAIADLYPERVILSYGADAEERTDDLEERFRRFDILSDRGASTQVGDSTGGSGSNNSASSNNRSNSGSNSRDNDLINRSDFSEEDSQGYLPHLAPIYVTLIKQHNQVVVRTQDEKSLRNIAELIRRLDVPTPLVLLEVKIMGVQLSDGFESAFDFNFQNEEVSGGFTGGDILPPDPTSLATLGGGLTPGSFVYQYVGDKVRGRMQLLENENRVTTLGSPLLLTANNEVSQLFVGEERPILVNFSEGRRDNIDGVVTFVEPTPQFELRSLGTKLLLTPSINADRTVALRILQEVSSISPSQAEILVPTDGALETRSIDFVTQQSVSGTVIAKDGVAVIMGGLIQEELSTVESKIPVLGDMPGVGFLFRRENDLKSRQELVVMIRPFVLNTPTDSDEITRKLMDELSLHPMAKDSSGTLNSFHEDNVIRARPENERLKRYFRFHSVDLGK